MRSVVWNWPGGAVKTLPNFHVSVRTMGVMNWGLSLPGKRSKDGTIGPTHLQRLRRHVDSILAKATEGMVPEVCGRGSVRRILVSTHATSIRLAHSCRTWEKVAEASIVMLNDDIGLEE
jgi:ribosomal protein L37AE/L43A